MVTVLTAIILSTLAISILSLAGAVMLAVRDQLLHRVLPGLVALSAGALMGAAFIHFLPKSAPQFSNIEHAFLMVLTGFAAFFVIEKYLHWHHCHDDGCDVESYAYMNLVGEVVHNFIDGVIIAAAYLANIGLGLATTFAVALHETPQELGDFGVLVHGGFSKTRALLINFAVALPAVLGGITGYYLGDVFAALEMYILSFAAGGFLYIAAADLVPEIRRETHGGRSVITFTVFLLGISIMYAVKHGLAH